MGATESVEEGYYSSVHRNGSWHGRQLSQRCSARTEEVLRQAWGR